MARKKKISPDQAPMLITMYQDEEPDTDEEETKPKKKPAKKKAAAKEPAKSNGKPVVDENYVNPVYLDPPPPGFRRVLFRCTHTPFGFCSGEPEWSVLPISHDGYNFHSGECGNSPDKCWKFSRKSIPMKDAPLMPLNKDRIIIELYKDEPDN